MWSALGVFQHSQTLHTVREWRSSSAGHQWDACLNVRPLALDTRPFVTRDHSGASALVAPSHWEFTDPRSLRSACRTFGSQLRNSAAWCISRSTPALCRWARSFRHPPATTETPCPASARLTCAPRLKRTLTSGEMTNISPKLVENVYSMMLPR